MLFRRVVLEGVAEGRIRLAFRRWRKAAVRTGGEQRTSIGVIRFGRVDVVRESAIETFDALAAGHDDRAALIAELSERPGDIYRIELALIGDDPRRALSADTAIDATTLAWLRRTEWADPVLRAIESQPGIAARSLAPTLGMGRDLLKAKVRRLKDRGLTISLDTGYRLSPRGEAALALL